MLRSFIQERRIERLSKEAIRADRSNAALWKYTGAILSDASGFLLEQVPEIKDISLPSYKFSLFKLRMEIGGGYWGGDCIRVSPRGNLKSSVPHEMFHYYYRALREPELAVDSKSHVRFTRFTPLVKVAFSEAGAYFFATAFNNRGENDYKVFWELDPRSGEVNAKLIQQFYSAVKSNSWNLLTIATKYDNRNPNPYLRDVSACRMGLGMSIAYLAYEASRWDESATIKLLSSSPADVVSRISSLEQKRVSSLVKLVRLNKMEREDD